MCVCVSVCLCAVLENALRVAKKVAAKNSDVTVEEIGGSRSDFMAWLKTNVQDKGISHRTSPACFTNGKFVGGNDDFVASVKGM